MAADRPPFSARSALDQDIHGLDALDVPFVEPEGLGSRVWSAAWPKLGAVAIATTIPPCSRGGR